MKPTDVLRSGDLDRRMGLYTSSQSQDSLGEQVITWNLIATVWGERTYPRTFGQELFAANQMNFQSLVWLRIRFRTDVVAGMQVVCEGQTYRVVAVSELGRRAGLQLRCEQVIPHA